LIDRAFSGHLPSRPPAMTESNCLDVPASARLPAAREVPVEGEGRVRAAVDAHYDFVWRSLRYLGLTEANAEDAGQQVMCILARRIGEVAPEAERTFLFSTAMRVAAEWRRSARRRPAAAHDEVDALAAETPSTEELLDQRRAHAVLEKVLDAIPLELRVVFVLFEIEEHTTPEIAAMVGVPVGTVASRLRRGREAFQAIVRRMQAAQRARGECP
jgi:RNA polymerase sigma-70 factor (ECF subfamily)